MKSVAKTDIGRFRDNNEDCIFNSEIPIGNLDNLFIVADGMGGYNGGEVASLTAIQSVKYFVENSKSEDVGDLLTESVQFANTNVVQKGKLNPDLSLMGTTIDVVTVKENKAFIAHIGDSRVYLINKTDILRITNDHNYAMDLFRKGAISLEEAEMHPDRNKLTRAIGVDIFVNSDLMITTVKNGDYLLLCSDGLYGMVNDRIIFDIVNNDNLSLNDKANLLIETANQNGGRDNISVVLVKC